MKFRRESPVGVFERAAKRISAKRTKPVLNKDSPYEGPVFVREEEDDAAPKTTMSIANLMKAAQKNSPKTSSYNPPDYVPEGYAPLLSKASTRGFGRRRY